MRVGFLDQLSQRSQWSRLNFRGGLLPRRKRSLRLLCANARGGYTDRQERVQNLGFIHLPWNRKFHRLRSTNTASKNKTPPRKTILIVQQVRAPVYSTFGNC